MVDIAKADIEHVIPAAAALYLASGDPSLIEDLFLARTEYRIRSMLRPVQAVGTGGITDGVGFVLFSAGVPHSEQLRLLVPHHVRAHHRHFLPVLIRRKHRPRAHTLPNLAVGPGRVAD